MVEWRRTWQWWAAYSVVALPVAVLAAAAFSLPIELVVVVAAGAASFRLADLTTAWLHKRGRL